MAAYLAEVCRDLTESMPNCSVAAGPAQMATDRAIRLALLVTELVTDAAKHAYGNKGGSISVTLALRDPQTATVSVILALVEQMDRSLRIDRTAQGASFTIDVALR